MSLTRVASTTRYMVKYPPKRVKSSYGLSGHDAQYIEERLKEML